MNSLLKEDGENINIADSLGRTTLHYAAQEGNMEIVSAILSKATDIDVADKLGRTGLHYAARYISKDDKGMNDYQCLRAFLEKGADINKKDNNNHTPVYYAAQETDWDTVGFLIERGANTDDLDKKSLLFHYTSKGNLELVKALINEKPKADASSSEEIDIINASDTRGRTFYMLLFKMVMRIL